MNRRDFIHAGLLLTLIVALLPKWLADKLLREWEMHPEQLRVSLASFDAILKKLYPPGVLDLLYRQASFDASVYGTAIVDVRRGVAALPYGERVTIAGNVQPFEKWERFDAPEKRKVSRRGLLAGTS